MEKRLYTFLESNNLLFDGQNGFWHGRSCLDHIFVVTSVVRTRLCHGLYTYGCFVDFAKAFDCVNWNCLFFKLLAYGLHGKMYVALKSLYGNLQGCV